MGLPTVTKLIDQSAERAAVGGNTVSDFSATTFRAAEFRRQGMWVSLSSMSSPPENRRVDDEDSEDFEPTKQHHSA
jgi:hypothetical protein